MIETGRRNGQVVFRMDDLLCRVDFFAIDCINLMYFPGVLGGLSFSEWVNFFFF